MILRIALAVVTLQYHDDMGRAQRHVCMLDVISLQSMLKLMKTHLMSFQNLARPAKIQYRAQEGSTAMPIALQRIVIQHVDLNSVPKAS